jgi:hypothetical protein
LSSQRLQNEIPVTLNDKLNIREEASPNRFSAKHKEQSFILPQSRKAGRSVGSVGLNRRQFQAQDPSEESSPNPTQKPLVNQISHGSFQSQKPTQSIVDLTNLFYGNMPNVKGAITTKNSGKPITRQST